MCFLDFWGVEAALCKIWRILGQNPRRNDLSKLTTFDLVFQLLQCIPMSNLISRFICVLQLFYLSALNFPKLDFSFLVTVEGGLSFCLLQFLPHPCFKSNSSLMGFPKQYMCGHFLWEVPYALSRAKTFMTATKQTTSC